MKMAVDQAIGHKLKGRISIGSNNGNRQKIAKQIN